MSANDTFEFLELITYEDFHFSNCTEASLTWEYFAGQSDAKETFDYPQEDISNFINHSLKIWKMYNSLPPPNTTTEFLDWAYFSNADISAEFFTRSKCPKQLCEIEGWTGSPDLAGPGMLATYIIQAILVSLYLLVIVKYRFWPSRSRSPRLVIKTRVAVMKSTSDFLLASALYSMSMLAASIFSIRNTELTPTFTAWGLELVIPINSVLPVVILNVAAGGHLIRKKGRAVLWVVIGALTIALTASSPFALGGKSKFNIKNNNTTELEKACGVSDSTKPMAVFAWIVAGLLILGISIYIIALLVSIVRGGDEMFGSYIRNVQLIVLGLSLGAMWIFLGWFVHLTLNIRERAGKNNKDREWTFGQVLALATWIPFLVEFAYQWWEEPGEDEQDKPLKRMEGVEMGQLGANGGRGEFQRLDSWRTSDE